MLFGEILMVALSAIRANKLLYSSLGVGALLFLGVTAAVLGSAGGILAQFIGER